MCTAKTFFNDENAQRPPQFNERHRNLEKRRVIKNAICLGSGAGWSGVWFFWGQISFRKKRKKISRERPVSLMIDHCMFSLHVFSEQHWSSGTIWMCCTRSSEEQSERRLLARFT